jgi:hypothetical protein
MSENESLKELQEQMHLIQQKISDKNKKIVEEKGAEFRKGDWIKNHCFIFRFNPMLSGLGERYVLSFGSNAPEVKSILCSSFSSFIFFGESKNLYENIILSSDDFSYNLKTDNAILFLEFLDKFKPKIYQGTSILDDISVCKKIEELLNES